MNIVLDLPACGLRAFYYWGMYSEIRKKDTWTVVRVQGRSAGAIIGICILCAMTDAHVIDMYHQVQEANKTLYIADAFCRVLSSFLPADAYRRCSGRLFITSSILGCFSTTTSVFRDNRHLLETVRVSGSLPCITTARLYFTHGVLPILDGCFHDCFHRRTGTPCTSPTDCTARLHTLHLRAPPTSWPDAIPVSAHHPLLVVRRAIARGAIDFTQEPQHWTH